MTRTTVDDGLRLKRAFYLLVCGCFGLLFAVNGIPPASAKQDLAPVYFDAVICTILGIVVGLFLARFASHVRLWEFVVAAILLLLIVSLHINATSGTVSEWRNAE